MNIGPEQLPMNAIRHISYMSEGRETYFAVGVCIEITIAIEISLLHNGNQ